jgi:hypothetical protein
MIRIILLSLKLVVIYFLISLIFYMIVPLKTIYNNTNIFLNTLAIIGINVFSFYQSIKYTLFKHPVSKKVILPLLIISFLLIATIIVILLSLKSIDNSIIIFTITIISLEFYLFYIYISKKDKCFFK